MAICGVCNAEPPKYKCPTCQIPYCSLACYKPHKAGHERSKPDQPAEPTPAPAGPGEKLNDQTGPTDSDPFAPLLKSPEVQQMLASQSLRQHLLSVHKATLEPPPGSTHHGWGRGRGRGGSGGAEQRHWDTEKGVKAGVGKLRQLREGNVEVDEFVNMVVSLLENGTAEV